MQSDIICLSETRAHSKDTLQYEGYKCYMNCMDNNSKKTSGGLATFIKRNIVHGILYNLVHLH
jgi:exonuclease III